MNIMFKLLKWAILVTLAATLIILAGCSSSSTSTTPVPPSTSMTMPPLTSSNPTTSSTAPTTSTAAPVGSAVTVSLTASGIAFDKSTITVPVNARVALNFNNKDNGIPHNFALYTDSGAGTSIFVGNVITSGTVTYTFAAPSKAGTYFFRCDIHPTSMSGSFIVQ